MDKWLAVIIRLILEKVSPQVADMIKAGLAEAKRKATETANPFDDLLIDILIFLTGGK